MTRANKVWDAEKASSSDLRQVRSACKEMPAANRQFADGLASSSWPSEAQESISLLVDEVRGDQLAWKELSEVSSEGKFFNPMNPLKEDTKTPDLVRAHLGLPAAEDIEESE
ncbi:hypothetical protein ACIQHZ_31400 [Streptomyces halstedii]|uniref:hypothetical protein n=1 Tax=Streptomyces halstedii TaxID=1944 RepID=UPI00382CF3E7